MAASMEPYEAWLTEKLLSLNPDTDTDVFVTYITGILDEDSPDDEKRESVLDLLSQVVEENQENVCDELFKKWEEIHTQQVQNTKSHSEELTDHLAHILETQKIEAVKQPELSAEDRARKQAILAQYAQVSSEEDDDDDDHGGGATGEDLLEFKNVNADIVKKTEQDMREKSRQEAEKKKEKDKLDREAQKQKAKDRKETEKKRTAKQERRR